MRVFGISAILCALLMSYSAQAQPRAEMDRLTHFTESFKGLCLHSLHDFTPLRQYARDAGLRNVGRAKQSKIDNVQTKRFRKWKLPLHGRRYVVSIDELPRPDKRTGRMNMCMVQLAYVDVEQMRRHLRATFRGKITNSNLEKDQYGEVTDYYSISGYRSMGPFIIVLRKIKAAGLKDGLVGLTGVLMVD